MAAYVAVVSLKRIIARLLNYYDTFFPPPVLEILKFADKELKLFVEFLGRLDGRSRKRMKASLGRIPEVISKFNSGLQTNLEKLVEDQSKESINGDGTGISTDLVEYIKQDTHSLVETLKKMEEEECCSLQPEEEDDDDDEEVPTSRIDYGGSRSKMVGLHDVYSEVKEDLVGNWVEKHVSTLVGMTGIGKTTLAKEIFEDLDVLEWFDCHAWVTVGREFKSEEISQAILAQILDCNAHEMLLGGSYEESLGRSLEGKRYLVVLDDVCEREVQFYLERSFPDNQNGSRILLTTTKQFLGVNFLFSSNLINMRLLDEEESWHLLCCKVFGENSCPPQYEKAGKKIAEKCDGLPLIIITVADLLLKAAKKTALESLWIEVATQKRHQIFTEAYNEVSEVLYPIYERLSEYLKSGFLYMGVFRQNYEIPKSKLFNLWIVGKLVEIGFHQSLDEFLEELTSHSLVVVYQRSTTYIPGTLSERIKTCALHSS